MRENATSPEPVDDTPYDDGNMFETDVPDDKELISRDLDAMDSESAACEEFKDSKSSPPFQASESVLGAPMSSTKEEVKRHIYSEVAIKFEPYQDQFRIVSKISQGSYGVVYRAVDKKAGVDVALKIFSLSRAGHQHLRSVKLAPSSAAAVEGKACSVNFSLIMRWSILLICIVP